MGCMRQSTSVQRLSVGTNRLHIADHIVRRKPKRIFYGDISYPKAVALNAELSQMMVDVLVHEDGPLLRVEWTEKRVRVGGAARGTLGGEALDRCDQPCAFTLEFALRRIRREQLR